MIRELRKRLRLLALKLILSVSGQWEEHMDNTIDGASLSNFSPGKIGTMELKNRLVFAPISVRFGSRERRDQFLLERARGGVGMVMLAAGKVMRDLPPTALHFRLYSDEFIPELAQISERIHAEGAKVGIQVTHVGSQDYFGTGTPVAPSAIFRRGKVAARELTLSEVEDLVKEFAEGVRRAKDSGIDLAEIHGAHGYLVSQFLSPRSNQRTDRYGGDIYGRARFLIEILMRARQKAGPGYPLSVRLNASDNIEGGITSDEFEILVRLVEDAGASLVNVSGGVPFSYPLTIAPFYAPAALYADAAERVRHVLSIPVAVGCRIETAMAADEIVREGKADFVLLGRTLIADPDLPLKAQRGSFDEIRPCLFCNQGCLKELQGQKAATCVVNPAVGREGAPTPGPGHCKNVMVIGGGLAGLEAAMVAAKRGHRVVLYEKEEKLGGQWRLAAVPPHKANFLRFLHWLIAQAEKTGVQIKSGVLAGMDLIQKQHPDVVVLATGARPIKPSIPGLTGAVSAWDVLGGRCPVGSTVVIVGGNSVGLETAHLLAEQGKDVTVLEMQQKIGIEMAPTVRWHLLKHLEAAGVQILHSMRLIEVNSQGLVVEKNGERESLPLPDDIVYAVGSRSENELWPVVEDMVDEVHLIGDAARPRSALEAVREGWEVGSKI